MRFKQHAIALLPALLLTGTPAIAQPKPTPVPQTSPALNSQQQQELQQLREEKRLQELIKKDLEDSKVIGDRVQAEVDRAFSHTTTLLNVLLVVLTLFPILTVLGAVWMRHSIRSGLLAEIKKSVEEIEREAVKQISSTTEQITSETKTQLEGMVLEANNVLQRLIKQTATAQKDIDILRVETKTKLEKVALDAEQEKERIFQSLSEITPSPSPIPQITSPEVLQKIQELTEQLAALKASNPQLRFTASDYEQQGDAFFSEKRYEEAILSYDKALELKPDDYITWSNRGVALNALQQHEKAISSYDKALELKPDSDIVLNNRGVALKGLRCYDGALSAFDKALELKPDNPEVRFNKACVYGVQGKVELAVEHLREAIKLNANLKEKAKTDPDFDAIREDERFKQLLEE